MRMNWLEKMLVNNPARAYMQRRLTDQWLRAEQEPLEDQAVLEIGCGQGAGAELLVQRCGARQVVAFDYDPAQVELARRRLSGSVGHRVALFVGDAECLPLTDGQFDVVIEFAILHHLSDWRRALGEIARVLKPGGRFFYEEFLSGCVAHPVTRRLLTHPRSGWFTAEEFYDALHDAGFTLASRQRQLRQWWLAGAARGPLVRGANAMS